MGHWTKRDVARLRNGLTIDREQFGFIVGVSEVTVRKWEKGVRNPSASARIIMDQLKDPPLLKAHLNRLKEWQKEI